MRINLSSELWVCGWGLCGSDYTVQTSLLPQCPLGVQTKGVGETEIVLKDFVDDNPIVQAIV